MLELRDQAVPDVQYAPFGAVAFELKLTSNKMLASRQTTLLYLETPMLCPIVPFAPCI